jgi:hypothetical protein
MKVPRKWGAEKSSSSSPEDSNKRIRRESDKMSLVPDSDLESTIAASSLTNERLAPAAEAGISKAVSSVERMAKITEHVPRSLYPRYSREASLLRRLKQVDLIELYKFAKNEFCTPTDESDWHDLIDHWILFHPYATKCELRDHNAQCKPLVYDREGLEQQQERLNGSHYDFNHFVKIRKLYNSVITKAVDLEEAVNAFLDFHRTFPWNRWYPI